jgi:NADH-quinone oxidoreductase subunit C
VVVDRGDPHIPTVAHLWPTADWHEREAFDLMGIRFTGHSDLRRLLLPDDWEGHPLRKDYVEKADYHGISTSRDYPTGMPEIPTRPAPEKQG